MPVMADKLSNVSVNSRWPLRLLTHNSSVSSGFVVRRQRAGGLFESSVFSRCERPANARRGRVHVRTCGNEGSEGFDCSEVTFKLIKTFFFSLLFVFGC